MKIKKNNFIFSNFNKPLSNKISTNELIPSMHINIDLNHNYITSANSFDYLLANLFTKEEYDFVKLNHGEILKNLIDVQIYEYFEEVSGNNKRRFFFLDKELNLLEYINKSFIYLTDVKFKSKPKVIIHNNIIHFYDANTLCYVDGSSSPIISTTSCHVTSCVNVRNILYFSIANDKHNIYISPNENLANLYYDTSLYLKTPINKNFGEPLKIVNIKHKVYIFQKYGIFYIDSSNDYTLINVCDINCKILKNTISSNESYIYFATTNGIYIFDGNDVKKIYSNISNIVMLDDSNIGLSYNNHYYLKTNTKDNGLDVIVKIDTDDSPIFYNIGKLSNIYLIKTNSFYNLIAVTSDYKFLCYGSHNCFNEKYIKFNKLTFNTPSLKHVTSIKVLCSGKFTIKISSETSSKTLLIENNTLISNIDIPGYVYDIEINTNDFFKIECIMFDVNIIEDIND